MAIQLLVTHPIEKKIRKVCSDIETYCNTQGIAIQKFEDDYITEKLSEYNKKNYQCIELKNIQHSVVYRIMGDLYIVVSHNGDRVTVAFMGKSVCLSGGKSQKFEDRFMFYERKVDSLKIGAILLDLTNDKTSSVAEKVFNYYEEKENAQNKISLKFKQNIRVAIYASSEYRNIVSKNGVFNKVKGIIFMSKMSSIITPIYNFISNDSVYATGVTKKENHTTNADNTKNTFTIDLNIQYRLYYIETRMTKEDDNTYTDVSMCLTGSGIHDKVFAVFNTSSVLSKLQEEISKYDYIYTSIKGLVEKINIGQWETLRSPLKTQNIMITFDSGRSYTSDEISAVYSIMQVFVNEMIEVIRIG